jgi:hypothetical protein
MIWVFDRLIFSVIIASKYLTSGGSEEVDIPFDDQRSQINCSNI